MRGRKKMKTMRAWVFVDEHGRSVPYHNEPVFFRVRPNACHPWMMWLSGMNPCRLVRVEIREAPKRRKAVRK